jgi:hypothetical protein
VDLKVNVVLVLSEKEKDVFVVVKIEEGRSEELTLLQ